MKSVALFNNKGGVGKTTLTYHLASMYADLGIRVLAVDLDPQANLTAMCLPEETLEKIWPDGLHLDTILGGVNNIMEGLGDIAPVEVQPVFGDERFGLLPGDLGLSRFEEELATAWPKVFDRRPDSLRSTTSFWRIIAAASEMWKADLALIDVGPSLGALSRAALICADYVVVPLAPDLFSVQSLKNLGPTLRSWRDEWRDRRERNANANFAIPTGAMGSLGYVVMQHAMRPDRPVQAYDRWLKKIPDAYSEYVATSDSSDQADSRLARLKNYRSLAPLAMEARRPMFALRSADGALGAQQDAVRTCYSDFRDLARRVASGIGLSLPSGAVAGSR